VILPAALTWMTRNRRNDDQAENETDEAELWIVPPAIRRRSEMPPARAA
jgi:hypothetical protein